MKGISKTLTKLVYTSKQREALELFFLSLPMSPLEERQRIEELSETTGLSRDQIKMWIRNRRNRGAYKGRVNLAIEQVSVLEWIFINITTYPSVSLKHLLASELDIRYDQIQKWFETRRLRGPPAILSRASNMDEEEWQRTVQRIHELVLLSKTDENENPKRKGISQSNPNPLSPKRKNRGDSPELKIFKRSRLEKAGSSSSSSASPIPPNGTPPESPSTDIQNRALSDTSFPAATFFSDAPFPTHTTGGSSLASSQPLPHRFDMGFQPQSRSQLPMFHHSANPEWSANVSQPHSNSLSPTNLPPPGLMSPSPSNSYNPFLSPPLPPLSTLVQNLHLSGSNGTTPTCTSPLVNCNSPTPNAGSGLLPGLPGGGTNSPVPGGFAPTSSPSPMFPMAQHPTSPLQNPSPPTPTESPSQRPLPLLAPWRPYLSSSNGFFE